MKTTVLTNIYNEEYLLPFWLNHHKNMFDHGIIIDYRSTDRSVEICKEICPSWTVITTRNTHFKAVDIDTEFMDIEKTLQGVKIVLNTTEFLFCDKPLSEIFDKFSIPISLSIIVDSPYSLNNHNPQTLDELYEGLLDKNVKYLNDRHTRTIHTYIHGNYTTGRHSVMNPTHITKYLHCVWLGFYPWNDKLLERKLQIKTNIPQSDKDQRYGFQHLFDTNQMLTVKNNKSTQGQILEKHNPNLYNLIKKKLT